MLLLVLGVCRSGSDSILVLFLSSVFTVCVAIVVASLREYDINPGFIGIELVDP